MTDPAALAIFERIAVALEQIAARDRPVDARVVRLAHAVYATLGDADFSASDLPRLAAAAAVPRPALAAAVGNASAKSLGKLLAEHVGTPLDGLRFERVGRRRWRVCAFETTQTPLAPNPWRALSR